jgi:hypothetical protein
MEDPEPQDKVNSKGLCLLAAYLTEVTEHLSLSSMGE